MTDQSPAATPVPAVSIVVPVRNEQDNVAPLIAEYRGGARGPLAVRDRLRRRRLDRRHRGRGSPPRCGAEQPAPVRHAAASRRPVGGGAQRRARRARRNRRHPRRRRPERPAFLPELIAAIEQGGARVGLAAGQRVGRKDTGFKRLQSRVANAVRNMILRDGTRDTGCGLKAFRREVFLALAVFRRPAPLPAGAGAPRGLRHRLCRRRRPAAPLRRVELRLLRPGCGSASWTSRRVVADPPQEGDAGGDGGELMLIQFGQDFGDYPLRRVRGEVRLLAGVRPRRAASVHRAFPRAVDFQRARRQERGADGVSGSSRWAAG